MSIYIDPFPDTDNDKGCHSNVTTSDAECQTTLTTEDMEKEAYFMRNCITELNQLKMELLNVQISEQAFRENDDKTKFYTGIANFVLLTHVFNLVATHIKHTSTNVLPQFLEFIITLMKLRLNCPFQDLAYRFGISISTVHVSRIFDKWIDIMSTRLHFLIVWPEREELRKTMQLVFKQNFGNKVALIIDRFEVFIERPASLIARAMTWSNYKHHNTVKFLIGITPQEVISFIPRAWGEG